MGKISLARVENQEKYLREKYQSEMQGTNEKPVDIPIQTQPQRPSDEPVEVREIVIEKPLKKQWSHNLCNCSGSCNDCCRSCCCPVLSLASLAEKIESNLFGKLNRRQNFQCAGMFAYFCCCPELLCFMTLLLREELKDKYSIAPEEDYRKACCISFFCFLCALRQMEKQMDSFS